MSYNIHYWIIREGKGSKLSYDLKGRRQIKMVTALGIKVPSFRGKHNQMKAKYLYVLYRYKGLNPSGAGLISHDIAYILNLPHPRVCKSLTGYQKWHYILPGFTPAKENVRRQQIYRLSSKGEQYLIRWNSFIPWSDYGWDQETIDMIDGKIKEVVILRGYK